MQVAVGVAVGVAVAGAVGVGVNVAVAVAVAIAVGVGVGVKVAVAVGATVACGCGCRCGRRRGAWSDCVDEVSPGRYTSRRVGPCGITPYLREVRRVLLHSHRKGTVCPSRM